MNLYLLLKNIYEKIQYCKINQINMPVIELNNENFDEKYVIEGFFDNENRILINLLLLSDIWNDLKPNKGMTIEEKHIEIAEFFGGKRYSMDFLIFMKLLNKRADIRFEGEEK